MDGEAPRRRLVVCASHSPLIGRTDGGPEGEIFAAGLSHVRNAVTDFDPDLVVFFGPDHIRAFQTIVPAFAIMTSAEGYGDWGTHRGPYDVPSELAHDVAEHVLREGIDVTVAADVRLDHGFGQTYGQLFGRLDAVPTIPIMINCARSPLAPVRRALKLGRAVEAFFAEASERILFVGSGGLSHSPPSLEDDISHLSEQARQDYNLHRLEEAAERINPGWDDRFLRALETQDWEWLGSLTDEQIRAGGVGAHEVRTWIAASSASGLAPKRVSYAAVRPWITGMGIVAAPEELTKA